MDRNRGQIHFLARACEEADYLSIPKGGMKGSTAVDVSVQLNGTFGAWWLEPCGEGCRGPQLPRMLGRCEVLHSLVALSFWPGLRCAWHPGGMRFKPVNR
jgi:hypothetical protein